MPSSLYQQIERAAAARDFSMGKLVRDATSRASACAKSALRVARSRFPSKPGSRMESQKLQRYLPAPFDTRSRGRPDPLPSGKSENRKRGTPIYSTMSLAQPIMTWRYCSPPALAQRRLTLWWQMGSWERGSLHRPHRPCTERRSPDSLHRVGTGAPMTIPQDANQRWSLDFVSDTLTDGRRFRILCVIDDSSRGCLATIVDNSLSGGASGARARSDRRAPR
jgi:hypothetical protein